jgi:hypothetical protein
MGLRDSILAAADIPTELVHGPEWDCDVEVRGMDLGAREAIAEVAQDSVKARESGGLNDPVWNASVVIATAFDPSTGERLFTSDDLAALNSKSAKAVMSVAEVGARLSGLTDEEEVEAGKDSPSIPDDDSSSS